MRTVLLILLGLAFLVACAPADAPTPMPPAATIEAPTAIIAATDSATSGGQPSAVVYGRTAEGAFFHGAADAPVTLTDYSDFL